MTARRKLRGSYPIRTHLIAFGLILVLPLTALAGVLFVRSATLERDQVEARLVQLADDLAEDIDRDIERHFTILNTLATLPSLQDADWPTFYAQAKAALQGNGYIVLIDSSLRQLVNIYVPYEEAPPLTGDPETARRMIKTKQREVSDLFISLVTKGPVFNINVPIVREGELRYILSYGRHADDLLAIMRGQRVGPDWVRAIIDRKGVVLARSIAHERVVGTAPPLFAADLAVADRSIRKMTSLEGEAVLRAAVRSGVSGWLVTVNVPLAIAEASLERSAALWGLTAAAALLLTLALAFVFANMISKPMMQAAAAARALGREEPIVALNSSISEANAIVLAIQNASAELRERLSQQRLLSRELNHRVKNVLAMVQAMVRRTLSDQRPVAEARELIGQRLQALARAQDLLLRTDWKDISRSSPPSLRLIRSASCWMVPICASTAGRCKHSRCCCTSSRPMRSNMARSRMRAVRCPSAGPLLVRVRMPASGFAGRSGMVPQSSCRYTRDSVPCFCKARFPAPMQSGGLHSNLAGWCTSWTSHSLHWSQPSANR